MQVNKHAGRDVPPTRHHHLRQHDPKPMARDIDYAAIAVTNAIVEKFGRQHDLHDLAVTANERTISVRQSGRFAEGTRDALLAALRKAESYSQFWEVAPTAGK
ncbi:MAG: hypothetical protein HY000_22180 [Planctomycetes bacterium]|nr:hypothetical protein [Planctomycetota bacterium]